MHGPQGLLVYTHDMGRAARGTHGRGRIRIGETDTLTRQTIKVGCIGNRVTEACNARTQILGHD